MIVCLASKTLIGRQDRLRTGRAERERSLLDGKFILNLELSQGRNDDGWEVNLRRGKREEKRVNNFIIM